jgi:hypothetical protein
VMKCNGVEITEHVRTIIFTWENAGNIKSVGGKRW